MTAASGRVLARVCCVQCTFKARTEIMDFLETFGTSLIIFGVIFVFAFITERSKMRHGRDSRRNVTRSRGFDWDEEWDEQFSRQLRNEK